MKGVHVLETDEHGMPIKAELELGPIDDGDDREPMRVPVDAEKVRGS